MSGINRRTFLGRILQVGVGLVVAPAMLKSSMGYAEAPAVAGSLPMLSPKDSTAMAVKYFENAKKSPESKGNKCATCSFYTKKEMHSGKEVGTCLVFTGQLVYANGYCNSWNKKQG